MILMLAVRDGSDELRATGGYDDAKIVHNRSPGGGEWCVCAAQVCSRTHRRQPGNVPRTYVPN